MINYCTKAERTTEKISDEEMELYDCFLSCDECTYFIEVCESAAEKAAVLNKKEQRLCPACGRLCDVIELDDYQYEAYIKCENCGTVGRYPIGGQ